MRGCLEKYLKLLEMFKSVGDTKLCYGKARSINAAMLAEMLEGTEIP